MKYNFSPNTNTIRIMPSNYLVARRVDCDSAVDINIAVLAFATVHNHYGYVLAARLNHLVSIDE